MTNPSEGQTSLAAKVAQVTIAGFNLEGAQRGLRIARANAKRNSQDEYARADVERAEADVAAAKLRLATARADLAAS